MQVAARPHERTIDVDISSNAFWHQVVRGARRQLRPAPAGRSRQLAPADPVTVPARRGRVLGRRPQRRHQHGQPPDPAVRLEIRRRLRGRAARPGQVAQLLLDHGCAGAHRLPQVGERRLYPPAGAADRRADPGRRRRDRGRPGRCGRRGFRRALRLPAPHEDHRRHHGRAGVGATYRGARRGRRYRPLRLRPSAIRPIRSAS